MKLLVHLTAFPGYVFVMLGAALEEILPQPEPPNPWYTRRWASVLLAWLAFANQGVAAALLSVDVAARHPGEVPTFGAMLWASGALVASAAAITLLFWLGFPRLIGKKAWCELALTLTYILSVAYYVFIVPFDGMPWRDRSALFIFLFAVGFPPTGTYTPARILSLSYRIVAQTLQFIPLYPYGRYIEERDEF